MPISAQTEKKRQLYLPDIFSLAYKSKSDYFYNINSGTISGTFKYMTMRRAKKH
jgi:hypothetical protein